MGDPTRHPEPDGSPREYFSQHAMRDESADDAASLTDVSRMNPFAALAAWFPGSIEDAGEREAEITDTVDLETPQARQLSEQRRTLEGRCAVALGEQERELRRELDSALQKQKQQSETENFNALQIQKQQYDEERDNALWEQKQQLESERDIALQEQKAQFEQKLEEELDFAGELLMRETEGNGLTLQRLTNRIMKASEYFGFGLAEDIDLDCKIEQFALLARLNTSRICQGAFHELSQRLNIPLERWCSAWELFDQEHTDEYMALLTSQVDRIVQACDNRVDTEQCRTTNVQRASLISKMKVSRTITDLREQIAANDKLWAEVVSRSEACLVAKDQHIGALTERLRLQTQVVDERHALLKQMADAAAALVG
ncbi:uncharacterized protein J4E92_008712 [Alternaria infectoria]|uniref:uncharacterized protein n=1 Tax=Alternaria infectoria TaxID=45303 RepID=UPI002220FA72|nr:uncharacterized protein J4E92_008712 [Alternaria infectoria]KAI4919068.1 hypothetical protein J4E92_008712 [Alternaria infectoria]